MSIKKVMLKYFVAAMVLTAATEVRAQILNIEKIRLDSLDKSHPYQISFESKFNFYNRSGSVDDPAQFISLTNDLNAVMAPGKISYVVLGKLGYAANNSETILNNGYLHLRSNFRYRSRWSEEVFAQIQYDNFRGLKNRYLVGGDERWQAIRGEKFELSLAAGPMFEQEVWQSPEDNALITVQYLKLSSYFIARWQITENVDFNTIFYYQVGYDKDIRSARNRISSSTNFNLKISKYISFTTSISLAYENKPIIPIKPFIYSVENGLKVTF